MSLSPAAVPGKLGGKFPGMTGVSITATGGVGGWLGRRGWYRWMICALLFFATTINYIDRQVIAILKTDLSEMLGWSEIDYSNIILAFQIAYAIGYAAGGRFMDRVGVRTGYAMAVLLWSLAAMAHGFNQFISPQAGLKFTLVVTFAAPWTVVGFCVARFILGLSEGGNFPAAVKTVSEWFPRRERALATGIFNAGSNVGALVTPLLVPWLTLKFGWPAAFYVTGALGLLWLAWWWAVYRSPVGHPRLEARELDLIRSDPPDPPAPIPWLELLRHRQTWAFVAGMFMSSPIWWFYLYWIPDYLHKNHGLDLKTIGLPLVVIYLMTDVGSIGGGWLSSWLIKRGWTVNAARKTAMLACALCVAPVFAAAWVKGLWLAVFLVGLAASAHQGFSANLFTLVSDTVPRQAVSSVVGIGGMAGAIGGMFIAKLVGYILQYTGSYTIPFLIASLAYLINLGVIHLILPRLEPMKFQHH